MWTGNTMFKLGYAAMSTIAITKRRTGSFDSLVFVFSHVLLPRLRHRLNCIVEKQLNVNGLFFV